MKPYSDAMRTRMVADDERGTKRTGVVETFVVSLLTVNRGFGSGDQRS
jgi:hypothetical protein